MSSISQIESTARQFSDLSNEDRDNLIKALENAEIITPAEANLRYGEGAGESAETLVDFGENANLDDCLRLEKLCDSI
jgi:hypothetical protein